MSTNIFLQLDGITGEAIDAGHKGWIEITSMNHSFSQPTTPLRASMGSSVEMCNHSDIGVTKYLDKATDQILKHIWSGKQLAKAAIECFRADGNNTPVKYLEINLEKVVVSNYNISLGEGSIPMENLSLSYGKVTYKYTQYDATGVPKGVQPVYHDLNENKVG